jgi:S-adenosyl-L-methionine hydrolase (adenosine-forming)
MDRPVLSLLTDFGWDGPAAICRAVIVGIARDAQIVDIGHSVRKYAIRDGAFLLWCAVPYLPPGSTHVAVVDPGVGTERRPIAIRTRRGDHLVGPDNGLLIPAARALGGIDAAHELQNRDLMLNRVTSTFHGRDIFSPIGAHLALGTPIADVGQALDPADLVDLRFPEPTVTDGALETAVVFVDSFGNVRLGGRPADLERAIGALDPGRPVRLQIGEAEVSTTWQRTFGQVATGQSLLYEDSFGLVSFADNQGNVAARLGIAADQPVRVSAA